MTDKTPARRPLYRTVLSLAVAALVAAWLPFTVFYVTARNHTSAAQITSVAYGHAQRTITTRTSGGQIIRSGAGPTAGSPAQALQPVTTHVS